MSADHASARLIDAYARGAAGPATSPAAGLAADEVWALEAHLETCRTCRDRLSAAVTATAPAVTALTDAVWAGLAPHLAQATPAPPRRRLAARLATWTTPAMTPWLAMLLAVTLLALLLDLAGPATGPGQVPLLLLLAPVLPVGGVALSWSPALDPAHELTAATPRAGLALVLRRTVAVLAVVIPALFAAGWATGLTAAQWLLPCLAFTTTTLALGGLIGTARAALALVLAWAAAVVAPALAADRTPVVLRAEALPAWGLLLALGAAVVAARRRAYATRADHR
ncbi:zf-HC2 domain-containing protein [Kitasatospora sp. NPDC008115]|uniref:zf-HC2 domain-containing protein n=1 Tax=Kitasatospora sp. NPDC008115 TaxID=3364022 RepID=UPI0036E19091